MRLGPDGAPFEDDLSPEAIKLVTFKLLKNGNTAEFVGLRNRDGVEIGVLEIGGIGLPTFEVELSSLTPLEQFFILAPEGTPVPELLVLDHCGDDPDCVDLFHREHEVVQFIRDPIEIDSGELPDPLPEHHSHYCSSNGQSNFQNSFCMGSAPSNAWTWCDSGKNKPFRDRWTNGHKRRRSFGITAMCNGTFGIVRHYYKNAFGNWKKNYEWAIPGSHWAWTQWKGGSKRDRWVHHRAPNTANGYCRAFTAIYNP